MQKFIWDNEMETYECTRISANGHYCAKWATLENSIDEYEFGYATCNIESENGNYCQAWDIQQTEYSKCFLIYNENDRGYSNVCCNDDNVNDYVCCATLCSDASYNAVGPEYQPEKEAADCHCVTSASNGNYCEMWHCTEYPVGIYLGYGNGYEEEDYTCREESLDGTYCQAWTGSIDGDEEFEVSTCQCDPTADATPEANSNLTACGAWRCSEKGADYWFPNWTWFLLPFIFGVLGVVAVIGTNGNIKEAEIVCIGAFVVVCAMSIIAAWKAGIYTVLFGLGGLAALLILFLLSFGMLEVGCWCKEKFRNEWKIRKETRRRRSVDEEGQAGGNSVTSDSEEDPYSNYSNNYKTNISTQAYEVVPVEPYVGTEAMNINLHKTTAVTAPSTVSVPPTLLVPPSSQAYTLTEQLNQLAELRGQGLLTEEEFTAAKSKILS